MAEENQNKSHEYGTTTNPEVEIKDRGVFDFLGKKKEEDQKPQTQAQDQEAIAHEFDKVKVSDEAETKPAEEKHSLADMLHRSNSSSSSSSDEEEEGEGGEKKKKKKEKKGLKEKIKQENTAVPVEKVEVDPAHPDHDHDGEEKKGFLDKIKDKLPGHEHKKTEKEVPPAEHDADKIKGKLPGHEHKKIEEEVSPAEHDAAHHAETTTTAEGEKKGLLEKIKEKMPGYHPKPNEEKEKESAAH